jgi:hypothetical protein
MEGLFELVAASLMRHGMGNQADSEVREGLPAGAGASPVEPPFPAALPEHNYRKPSPPDQTP